MKIYVGRWDMLPEDWEGINGLYEKSEEEIRLETEREYSEYALKGAGPDDNIGTYEPKVFEETFNHDLYGLFTTQRYWIKIF